MMNFNDFGIDSASMAGSLENRLNAARQAGFSHVMISATDIVGHPSSTASAVQTIRDSGLRVTGLEALRDFEGLSGKMHDYKIDVAKSMLSLCSQIGGRLLLTEASSSAHADTDPEKIARDLRKLAFLALPMGIRIAFKGLSWSRTVKNFADAAEIISLANCPNLGLAIDAFDVIAAEVPLGDLDLIFPQQIFLVQLSDFMLQEVHTTEEQETTATHFRVFPGEGAHSEALAKFIVKLEEIGYFGDYSFDVYNSDYLQIPAEVIAERARRAAEWLGETVLRRTLPVPNMERLRLTARDRGC
ncbi:sugar phosphate isomerase/epimerase family protein [Propionivibrio limicola]|uniref:sugar phosphate isomerase/epimerase family protein n=1 Tax=Propionivibrio limicola TaxID=167645 RepID=UPI001B870A27|nr:sugar phosphate isomerase/epimerase [Propionivibrio limicola]